MKGGRLRRTTALLALALTSTACSANGSSPAPEPLGAANVPLLGEAFGVNRRATTNDGPTLGGCAALPADNPWNEDVSQLPVDPNSENYLTHMHATSTFLHSGFGRNPNSGIPITVVPRSQPFVPMKFIYAHQSDPGPYPFPLDVGIEGGVNGTGDRHALVVDTGNCTLYETYRTFYVGPGWRAGSGAVFDLSSNKLRPNCHTSADAAGLPIAPALPRYEEVEAGAIEHAMRFTMSRTQAAFVHPATHFASTSTDPNDPPMGLRVRLKGNFDVSKFRGVSLVILTALKKYGMFLADNGSDWYIAGSPDTRWNDADLAHLKAVPATAFEVVKLGRVFTRC